MNFQINALNHQPFQYLFNLNDTELKDIGGIRMIVNENPGFPCRVSLEDATIGEEVLLIPFEHHKTNSPYQAKGPIFIRKGIEQRVLQQNEIPKMLEHRLLSFRGYDKNGIMKSAITGEGKETKNIIKKIFNDNNIAYIHIHNSSPGCFNCEVNRIAI
jgi:hypothetical protein